MKISKISENLRKTAKFGSVCPFYPALPILGFWISLVNIDLGSMGVFPVFFQGFRGVGREGRSLVNLGVFLDKTGQSKKEGQGTQISGPFRTKNTTAPASVVFCYRRSFSLSVPFSCLMFPEEQAFLSPLRSVLLRPYRVFLVPMPKFTLCSIFSTGGSLAQRAL